MISSFCSGGQCVDVTIFEDRVEVRDTKHSRSPALVFTNAEWVAFLQGVRAGEFDPRATTP